jgi:hypothetical protein
MLRARMTFRVCPNGPPHDDAGVAGAVGFNQPEQDRRIGGMQPDAAMRGRTAEARNLVAAVDREAAVEEDGMRHRRVVIFF